jgi:antitoxin CptB
MFEPEDPAAPPETCEARRRRLIHRSLYTGMKETDLLLGPFALRHVPDFSLEQLDRYEHLLTAPDPDIFDWATRRQAVPAEHDHDVMDLLRNFKSKP